MWELGDQATDVGLVEGINGMLASIFLTWPN